MDECAFRTLAAARASGQLTPVAVDFLWTLLDWESEVRYEHYQAAMRAGMTEVEAQLQELPPVRAYTKTLEKLGRMDRRRVKEHMDMVCATGVVKICDRKSGYYDYEIIHLPPETATAARPNPTAVFAFIREPVLDTAADASIESTNQREASPGSQRHRSGGIQRAAAVSAQQAAGRPVGQRGGDPGSTSLATVDARPGLDGSGEDFSGVTASAEAARRFSGAPARRFSGAPSDDRTDDVDEVEDCYACAPAPSTSRREVEVLKQETNSSSSSVRQEEARRISGAPELTARRKSGAPVLDLWGLDPPALPWAEIRPLANSMVPILNPGGTGLRQKPTRNLVLTAAIAAAVIPELGQEWLDRALEATKSGAKRSPVGYFRVCLAEGLEVFELCDPSPGETPVNGMRTLSILQRQLGRAVAWFESRKTKPQGGIQ